MGSRCQSSGASFRDDRRSGGGAREEGGAHVRERSHVQLQEEGRKDTGLRRPSLPMCRGHQGHFPRAKHPKAGRNVLPSSDLDTPEAEVTIGVKGLLCGAQTGSGKG